MKTTATNRKLRTLIVGIRDQTLIPRPEFQRRLVWTSKDKQRFLDTVLRGYPFPEIYIASGNVDADTGEGTEMLVDGQQRVTTLYQYFIGSPELRLGREFAPYSKLDTAAKTQFLEYDVVVRDLGQLEIDQIKEVFERINATKYSLNDMEIHNARFAGEFKQFAERISQHSFFERHRIFSANEIRRMRDVGFVLTFIITIMSSYFNRDDELEDYLAKYNDEFENSDDLDKEIEQVLSFVDEYNLPEKSRAWKKSDLLTLLVETYRVLFRKKLRLDPTLARANLEEFYSLVDTSDQTVGSAEPGLYRDARDYAKAASQATNDRSSRILRGEIIQRVLTKSPD